MENQELKTILELHRRWAYGDNYDDEKGKRADLSGADLRFCSLKGALLRAADLSGALLKYTNLKDADLQDADLQNANLVGVNLSGANLKGASLIGANLRNANFYGADLTHAFLGGADLRDANFIGSNLEEIYEYEHTAAQMCICPQEGSFIAFKKAYYTDECRIDRPCIVKLEIPADAKRSNALGRKCRASKARVMSIETIDGKPIDGNIRVFSERDRDFKYSNGITVEPTYPFDEDQWKECASGIHFFITREEAVCY